MTIKATVLADSITEYGVRVTTMQLRYPRFIHSEFMTHRVFSRNASSSRAIPVQRLIQDVIDDPVEPCFWGKNQPGMQAREEITGEDLQKAKTQWNTAKENAIFSAKLLCDKGVHKQIVNRILEPYAHINVVVTSTSWNNFFSLRHHKDAQPEIMDLAAEMIDCLQGSVPTKLKYGEWHLPYVLEKEREGYHVETLQELSAARCARVSYLTHEGEQPAVAADLRLYDRLASAVPGHYSPLEHQATPDRVVGWKTERHRVENIYEKPHFHGNLKGVIQFRKIIENYQ